MKKQYNLTKKGKNFDWENPKFIEEEKAIIESLETGRKSVNQILTLLTTKLKKQMSWYLVERHLEELKKEGYVKEK